MLFFYLVLMELLPRCKFSDNVPRSISITSGYVTAIFPSLFTRSLNPSRLRLYGTWHDGGVVRIVPCQRTCGCGGRKTSPFILATPPVVDLKTESIYRQNDLNSKSLSVFKPFLLPQDKTHWTQPRLIHTGPYKTTSTGPLSMFLPRSCFIFLPVPVSGLVGEMNLSPYFSASSYVSLWSRPLKSIY